MDDLKTVFSEQNVAQDNFGIDLQGAFKTASFGGERLEVAPAAQVTLGVDGPDLF